MNPSLHQHGTLAKLQTSHGTFLIDTLDQLSIDRWGNTVISYYHWDIQELAMTKTEYTVSSVNSVSYMCKELPYDGSGNNQRY